MKRIVPLACMAFLSAAFLTSAPPALAVELPKLLPECATVAAVLQPVVQRMRPTAAVSSVATMWLEQAAALPDPQAQAAYGKAVKMTVSSLLRANVAATPLDVLIYRFVSLELHRREFSQPFPTGGGPNTLLEPIDRELELIATLLPPECLF